ncbi:MAG: hypothetical protein Q4B50_00225 [Bacillota bacterium]|nr:hypothetical protein [Bacillota bacterium]
MDKGKTLVLPKACFSEKKDTLIALDYNAPLVLNASRQGDQIFFHLFDAEDAYKHRGDVLPQHPDLHWYDYVLDFFAKFFGCRREVCEEWNRFQENARLRNEATLNGVKESLHTGKFFSDLNNQSEGIPYATGDQPKDYAQLDEYIDKKSLHWKVQQEYNPLLVPGLEDVNEKTLPNDPELKEPEENEEKQLIAWFKNRYETKNLQLLSKAGNAVYPQLFNPSRQEKQRQANRQIHNNFLFEANRSPFQRQFAFSSDQEISLSAAFYSALAYGVAKENSMLTDHRKIFASSFGEKRMECPQTSIRFSTRH